MARLQFLRTLRRPYPNLHNPFALNTYEAKLRELIFQNSTSASAWRLFANSCRGSRHSSRATKRGDLNTLPFAGWLSRPMLFMAQRNNWLDAHGAARWEIRSGQCDREQNDDHDAERQRVGW
jgi:hypothetical protein